LGVSGLVVDRMAGWTIPRSLLLMVLCVLLTGRMWMRLPS
jgi:uncharacterized membrane protein